MAFPAARQPMPIPPDGRVDAIARRAAIFSPKLWMIPSRQSLPAGPILISPPNRRRIALWVKALRVNAGQMIFLGDQSVVATLASVTAAGSTGYSGGDGWELEAGDVLFITETTAAIWAVTQDNASNICLLRSVEFLDPGP